MNYLAHSANSVGIEQSMLQHGIGVSEIMKSFALSDDFAEIYSICGLLHDVGKYNDEFQKYIRSEGTKEPHAKWGAYIAKNLKLINVAFPIIGHHAGLPNRDAMFETLELLDKEPYKFAEIQHAMDEDGLSLLWPDNTPFNSIDGTFQKELFIRLLYSALVDADSLDTERHFHKEEFERRSRELLNADVLLAALNNKFKSFNQNTPLNELRTSVRLYAQQLATAPQGCFSMTLPTGMGKTLTSLNWALCHAKAHPNIKRIVIVLPFISIIDQTASELKNIFKDYDVVLEHHSNVINEGASEEDYYCKDSKDLATENWDYPIIITTAVQFFESLFSNQRSKCRKLHNLQDSIVIFDEIQTLPVNLAECTMKMLNDMLNLCRCSFLFCTATQPNFQTRKDFCGIDHITSLVEDPVTIFAATQRVKYNTIADYEPQTFEDIANRIIEQNDSVLIVCNTKKKAVALFETLKGKSMIQVFHLSTNMCQIHRMKIINGVRSKLLKGEKLILCSTQLIEAGVDMDFPVVFRELAPLESIIQSAGRCNREGKLKEGQVFLFQLEDTGQPSRQYETFAQYAQLCYRGNEDRLSEADFYTEYYTKIIELYATADDITPKRKDLLFSDISDMYRIINNDTTSLFIRYYNDESRFIYNEIKDKDYLSRKDYQKTSHYCVQVYDWFLKANADKIKELSNGVRIWAGAYSDEIGLCNDNEIYCI